MELIRYNGYDIAVSYSAADDVIFGKIMNTSDCVLIEVDPAKGSIKSQIQKGVDDYIADTGKSRSGKIVYCPNCGHMFKEN